MISKLLKYALRTGVVLIMSLITVEQVTAAVTYTQDRRSYVSSSGDDLGSTYATFYPSSPYADWTRSGHSSSLNSSGFTANGYGYAYSDYFWVSSESFFDITFSLSTSTEFSLTGILEGNDFWGGTGDASIGLFNGDNTLAGNLIYGTSISAMYGYDSAIVDFYDILGPGEYRLVAKANPYFIEADSRYDINATFVSAVPVPAAVWLFGSGLIGVIGLARRKKNNI